MWITKTPGLSDSKFITSDIDVMLIRTPAEDKNDFRLMVPPDSVVDIVSDTATIELIADARKLVEPFISKTGATIEETSDGTIKFQSEFIVFKRATSQAICVAFINSETGDVMHADPTIESSLVSE